MHLWDILNKLKMLFQEIEIVKYIEFHFVFEKPYIFMTKQYLTSACCHGNQNHRIDNTFG